MSESASDTESSCEWTVISHEGSDIECLVPENGMEFGTDLTESSTVVEPDLQDQPASSIGECIGEGPESLDASVKNKSADETLSAPEAGDEAAGKDHVAVCSCSDYSDIVTLGDLKDEVLVEEEAAVSEDLYLGTSSSSQYAFTAAETVLPVQQPVVADSSSSDDEDQEAVPNVVRRRRLRKTTVCAVTEPEVLESGHSEHEEEVDEEVYQNEQAVAQPCVAPPLPGRGSSALNRCILLALVVAISMGFGHFYGTVQIQERQKGQLSISKEVVESLREDLDENRDTVQSLTRKMELMMRGNHDLRLKLSQMQAQKDNLVTKLKQTTEETAKMESQHKTLVAENQQLKGSLEREEKSLSALQEELSDLRYQIRELEDRGVGADSVRSENQRLKEHLEQERQRIRSFTSQRESQMSEVLSLRKEIEKERKVTDQLREELEQLSRDRAEAGEANPEMEELQSRLMELEKRLSFEQQRSDLWERLYVETKEERAKGDTRSKVKQTKEGMLGKVKETFDAVKNSTKEFVHHHKEQIKKAKEAVKENLRKFSDSVKSTFRFFKDSASPWANKAGRSHDRRFNEKKDQKEYRSHKPFHSHQHKPTDNSFQGDHNTRKSGNKVHEDQDKDSNRGAPRGCSGVFDCAHQESMNLFNKATEPIRADEFNQLLHSYLQQEVDHFRHWKELEKFINNFFHNGVFIHDRMLFTDFVNGVEDYLEDMQEYRGLDDDVFEDLDDYVYRHFFGDSYFKCCGPSGPETKNKEELREKHQRKQQRARPRPQRERKWSQSGRNRDGHMADVKIELGPMPFDPKY